MITIYGSPQSSAGRCFWCLEEAETKYKIKSISFKDNEHRSEEFLKINPNGKIPALTDGDFTIWESMAINFYIADAYKPELLGKEVKDRGLVHQWSIWSIADLQTPMVDVLIQLVFVPEERRNFDLIDKALKKLPNLLKTLEIGLNDKNHLVGNNFTLADLNVASVVSICDQIKFDLAKFENITKWRTRISQRGAFKRYRKLCNK